MMKLFKRLLCLLLITMTICGNAMAVSFDLVSADETDAQKFIRGYSASDGYVYINLGRYPYTKEGDIMPVLWRVLGVDNGIALLYTEYCIDFAQYNETKADLPLWKDNTIYKTLNFEMVPKMFHDDELSAIVYTDEKGWLYYLDNADLHNVNYGFRNWTANPQKERKSKPTPYAMTHPEAYINSNGCTWYFSTGVPRRGCHSLIGFDGHTSVAASNRYGGVRAACKIDLGMLDGISGSGTINDPYMFSEFQ